MNDHNKDETQNADEPTAPLKRPQLLTSGDDHLVAFADGGLAELTEVMTLMRDPADGRLVVHMNGYAYRSLGHHPAVKKHFTALMKELSGMIMQPAPPRPVTDLPPQLQNAQTTPQKPAPKDAEADNAMDGDTLVLHKSDMQKAKEQQKRQVADENAPAKTDMNPPSQPEKSPENENVDAPDLDDLLMMPDLDDLLLEDMPVSPPDEAFIPPEELPDVPPPRADGLPGDLPDFKSYAEPTSEKKGFFGRRKVEYNAVPELNIAGAIETFLQHKLVNLPEWKAYGLHVHPAKDGTLRIEVKGKFYQAVSDIQDEKVRNFLSETIQEWQERQ